MNKAELVSEYEKKHDIPENERYMTYIEQYGCFMPKIGIAEEEIEERYQRALMEQELEDKKKEFEGIYTVVSQHNLKDQGRFSSKNFKNMVTQFYRDTYKKKELGVENDGIYYPVLTIREGMEYPDLEPIPNCEARDAIIHLQKDWFLLFVSLSKEALIRQTKEVVEMSGYISPKQRINFAREFKKMQEQRICISDARLDHYDFRECNCANMLFLNCNLEYANFAHVNLQNTTFINCNLNNAIFYGANTNGCVQISGDKEDIIDSHRKISKGVF